MRRNPPPGAVQRALGARSRNVRHRSLPRRLTRKSGPASPPKPDPVLTAITQPAPQPPATGPYAGAAGSEAQNPGRPRTPMPDWADPSSPNYERRNYYIHPVTGEIVAREPGYYNPENPWDTGRPNEAQGDLMRTYGYSAEAIAPYERRMDEPGITPWGPGGKPSPPGAFPAPGGGGGGAQRGKLTGKNLLDALGQHGSRASEFAGFNEDGAGSSPDQLLALLRALIPQGAGRSETMAPGGPRVEEDGSYVEGGLVYDPDTGQFRPFMGRAPRGRMRRA